MVSTTLTGVTWPTARIIGSTDEIRALKHEPGNAVYIVGGPTLVTNLLDADLIDELRLIVHPILAGAGQGIAGDLAHRQTLQLVGAEPTANGHLNLTYRLTQDSPGEAEQ